MIKVRLLNVAFFVLINLRMASPTTELYADSSRKFSSKLFSAVAGEEEASNIVCSPLSAHVLLAYLSHGACNQTASEMMDNLFISDLSQLHIGYQSLVTDLSVIKEAKLHLANAIFIHNDIELLTDFSNLGKDAYKFSTPQIDLKDKLGSSKQINNWILDKTNNQLSDVISQDDVGDDAKIILVNAIYFKGFWKFPFDPQRNIDWIFHSSKSGEKTVSMMIKKERYSHGHMKDIKAQFLELPYTDENLSMVVVLPDEINGLPELEKSFDWSSFTNVESSNRLTTLHLPKFKIECKLDLKNILIQIGLKDIFEDTANFSKMSTTPLKVDRVIQKAFIEVNEKGSEAAAATAVKVIRKRSTLFEDEFIVDHPFLVIIRHIPSNIPLFIGSVRDIEPVQKRDEL